MSYRSQRIQYELSSQINLRGVATVQKISNSNFNSYFVSFSEIVFKFCFKDDLFISLYLDSTNQPVKPSISHLYSLIRLLLYMLLDFWEPKDRFCINCYCKDCYCVKTVAFWTVAVWIVGLLLYRLLNNLYRHNEGN